jgi:outer membrane protein assembly factor BamB
MKKLLIVMALAAIVAPLSAQPPSRLYSEPDVPPREALERLRLKAAWTAVVPTDKRRDGLFSVQLMPRDRGLDLLVQTRSGGIMCYDADTGLLRWSTRVGVPYRVAQPLGYNRESVFVVNNIDLIALDRANGHTQWEYDLPSGAAAPPVADDEQVYLTMTNGRFATYMLPNFAALERQAREGKARGSAGTVEAAKVKKGIDLPAIGPLSGVHEGLRVAHAGPQPVERFSFIPDDRVEDAPVVGSDRILLPGVAGEIAAVARTGPRLAWRPVYARGKIRVPVGQYGDTAYVSSDDFTTYAVSLANGRVFWRFGAGGPPIERPAVLDEDVYVAASRSGLIRVDRATGEQRWQNEDGARFLASNRKFVYAADRTGRLLVLDRDRGTTLSTYDSTRDFVVPVQNDLTDRVYLAANSGLIICLHDRDAEAPVAMKTVRERAALPAPGGARPGPREPREEDGAKPAPKEPKGDGGAKPKEAGGAKPKEAGGAMEKP